MKSHNGNQYIKNNGKLDQKGIPTTLLKSLREPIVSVTRVNNFLLITTFAISLVGFQKLFLFWVAGIVLVETMFGTGVVMGI